MSALDPDPSSLEQDARKAIEALTDGGLQLESQPVATDNVFAPELFAPNTITELPPTSTEDAIMQDAVELSEPAEERRESIEIDVLAKMASSAEDGEFEQHSTKKSVGGKPTKRDTERSKDTKHSSKNEGQHTDRRYLCYVCHKLFTRRRSVRDHLQKIHGEKTWEPTRSLEIIVEPHSGEPLEPLEVLIAKGPPPPLPKPEKSAKSAKGSEDAEEDDEEEEQEQRDSIKDQTPDLPKPKIESSAPESRPTSLEPSQTPNPAPIIGKKRPLPMKKGTAKLKSSSSTPHKRQKLMDSETSTPARSPSVTPATKGSRLKKIAESPVPSSRATSHESSPSPTPSVATPASTNDDGEIFCICRKGDNHTWMIACDGGCEEWFHGKCVDIRERDGELIDKYICPNCSRDGFITTWKRMCRRKGCRKPAKVFNDPPSKYCSPACGRLFFVELIKRGDFDADTSRNGQYIVDVQKPKKVRKKVRRDTRKAKGSGQATPMMDGSRAHTPAYSDEEKSEYETDSSLDECELPNRGGPLRAGEVKAILEKCKTVDEWRTLGKKPATPPQDSEQDEPMNLEYDKYEKGTLDTIKSSLANLQTRTAVLTAREKMLELMKVRSASITEEVRKENPKMKDLCGYDPRVGWSEDEFVRWWKGEGEQVLASGKIGPPGDETMTNGHDNDNDSDTEDSKTTTKGGVCIRNRCQKHGSNKWQRGQLAELRFEQDLIAKSMDRLLHQQSELRSRAVIRSWEKR